MKYAVWLLTLPLRIFEAIADRFVEPPADERLSPEELRSRRNVLLEELEKPQAGGMGGGS